MLYYYNVNMKMRLNKYIASTGQASRRKADELISAGRVKIDGKIVTELGTKIDPDYQHVSINSQPLKQMNFIYIRLNKPEGYTCTTKTFAGEKNVLDLLDPHDKVYPVGRLDKNSCGLIFLTNDGRFAFKLTHPRFQVEKEYKVTTATKINKADLDQMKKGITDENEHLHINHFQLINPTTAQIILSQGKKREIRRLFKHFGYEINKLQRIRIGRWPLGKLAEGQWEYFQP